jgi:hypothetical protein
MITEPRNLSTSGFLFMHTQSNQVNSNWFLQRLIGNWIFATYTCLNEGCSLRNGHFFSIDSKGHISPTRGGGRD